MTQEEAAGRPFGFAPHSGYHRLTGAGLQVIADSAPPAAGPWSPAACAQPLAIEVAAGPDRLFANCGWSPDCAGGNALRRTAAGCTAVLEDASAGEPLSGRLAHLLGPRLVGGARKVEARRNENEAGVWLELGHDGWVDRFSLLHERRLFLNRRIDELRGEDRFVPVEKGPGRTRPTPFAVHFHIPPEVQVSLARDRRSVLLRGASARGWRFRTDAGELLLEPSVHLEDGLLKRSLQVVLRGEAPAGMRPARVRWKLTPVEAEAPLTAGPEEAAP